MVDVKFDYINFISHARISVVIVIATAPIEVVVIQWFHGTLAGEVPSSLEHVLMFVSSHHCMWVRESDLFTSSSTK